MLGSAGRGDGVRPGSRRADLIAVAGTFALGFAWFAAIGLARYRSGRAGNYDLGIFSQAAQAWSGGQWPRSTIRGVDNLFADHASPITVVFGAAWRVWPDPQALIVVHAAALATGAALVCLGFSRVLGVRWGLTAGLAACLVKGSVSAAVFDVHEAGLGVPLMAGLCLGLLWRRPPLVFACAAGLLLVKEDLGATVVVAGLVWFLLTRTVRPAVVLAVLGVVGLVTSFVVVRVVSGRTSVYLGGLLEGSENSSGFVPTMQVSGYRAAPLVLFVLTCTVVGLRSPVALLAVPTLAWRALSNNPSHWQTYFHYDALLVPIAAVAVLDVVTRARVAPAGDGVLPRRAVVAGAAIALAVPLVWGVQKAATVPFLSPSGYSEPARVVAARELAHAVPDGERVVVQQDLGPRLIARLDVAMLSSLRPVTARWVLLSADGSQLAAPECAKRAWLAEQEARDGVDVQRRDGVVLVRLPAAEPVRLSACS